MTPLTQKGYRRIARLFMRWCSALGMPAQCRYEQLASWAWMYCQRFSQRSLAGHWSALKWWCDTRGLDWPLPDSVCMSRLRRVTRALALRDPTVERRCYALTNNWLVKMMAVDGLRTVDDLRRPSTSLAVLSFWVRVRAAHFAMMRLCEHQNGMLVSDLQRFSAAGVAVGDEAPEFFTLRVGYLPAGVSPLFATNRKLKLRAARFPVLPIWQDVSSAGLLMDIWLRRLRSEVTSPRMLFPGVRGGSLLPGPLSPSMFLRRLRNVALVAGMPPDDVGRIECRSLRADGCTDFFAMGVARDAIMRQGGWTSKTVDIYNRPTELFRWASFAKQVQFMVDASAAGRQQ